MTSFVLLPSGSKSEVKYKATPKYNPKDTILFILYTSYPPNLRCIASASST